MRYSTQKIVSIMVSYRLLSVTWAGLLQKKKPFKVLHRIQRLVDNQARASIKITKWLCQGQWMQPKSDKLSRCFQTTMELADNHTQHLILTKQS